VGALATHTRGGTGKAEGGRLWWGWLRRPSAVWLVAGLFVGATVWFWWLIGALMMTWPSATCSSPQTTAGWANERTAWIVAAVMGAVLWAVGGIVAKHLPRRWSLILLVFAGTYIATLIGFTMLVAPAIWGSLRCV